jgi:hypothetical protein
MQFIKKEGMIGYNAIIYGDFLIKKEPIGCQ